MSADACVYHGVAIICSVSVRAYQGNCRMATPKSRILRGMSLSISLSIDVLLLSKVHSRARVVTRLSCRDCYSLLIALLLFSSLACSCQSLVVRRHRANIFLWHGFDALREVPCLKLMPFEQVMDNAVLEPQTFPSDDYSSHHKSWKSGSENDTIKLSSLKGLGEVRFEKTGHLWDLKTGQDSKLSKNAYMLGVMLNMTEIWCFWCRLRAEKHNFRELKCAIENTKKKTKLVENPPGSWETPSFSTCFFSYFSSSFPAPFFFLSGPCGAHSGTFFPEHHPASNARQWSDRAHSASSSSTHTHTQITPMWFKRAGAWWEDSRTAWELALKFLSLAGWSNHPIESLVPVLILRCSSETSSTPYPANSPLKVCHSLKQLQHLLS